jgi:hypothetical protein
VTTVGEDLGVVDLAAMQREGVFWIALSDAQDGVRARITSTLDIHSGEEHRAVAPNLEAAVAALEAWWRQFESRRPAAG